MERHNSIFSLEAEYSQIRESCEKLLIATGVEYDPQLASPETDDRLGLGAFFLHTAIRENAQDVLMTIKKAFPDETVIYGLPGSPATMHTTLLEYYKASPPEEYDQLIRPNLNKFMDITQDTLSSAHTIHAHFSGLIATPAAIIMAGYPEDQYYNQIRDTLREKVANANLPLLKRRVSKIFHATVARFVRPITDIPKLLNLVNSFSDYDFGSDTFATVMLASSSWLIATSTSIYHSTYELQPKD